MNDATAKATHGRNSRNGRRHGSAGQSLAPRYQPHGVAAAAGAEQLHTLRELHGVIQVAMGWEGIHLYDFELRAARYGSWELSASSPDVTLASLRLRKGVRFIYEYDLNIPWRHEVRIEDRLRLETGKTYPFCSGGSGACPPEDCGGPQPRQKVLVRCPRGTWIPWRRLCSGLWRRMARTPSRK